VLHYRIWFLLYAIGVNALARGLLLKSTTTEAGTGLPDARPCVYRHLIRF
jgi:hypothetical protein